MPFAFHITVSTSFGGDKTRRRQTRWVLTFILPYGAMCTLTFRKQIEVRWNCTISRKKLAWRRHVSAPNKKQKRKICDTTRVLLSVITNILICEMILHVGDFSFSRPKSKGLSAIGSRLYLERKVHWGVTGLQIPNMQFSYSSYCMQVSGTTKQKLFWMACLYRRLFTPALSSINSYMR